MAGLAAIRDAFRDTLAAALPEVRVYDTVPGRPVLPCLCVIPNDANFNVAMSRGTDTWTFDVIVLVPSADGVVGQELLDPYVTGAGASSVRQIVFGNRTLGLAGTDAHIAALTSYGGTIDAAGVGHVGATLRLIVHTPGTE